ncbi:hypothetical protein [Nocardiopsis sp. CNR-923]|uniref:hypothetical protein n=1 Tax=Nocardiopsis sp. CNR-923 TaxID=1904965 RepID=UPI0021CCA5DC|nr:hypothetical protein [Nocardiopsis sp. CNR-923]
MVACTLYSAAAFCEALRSDKLPKYTVLNAFIVVCGGAEADFQRWVTAWRRLDEDEGGRPPVVLVPIPPLR